MKVFNLSLFSVALLFAVKGVTFSPEELQEFIGGFAWGVSCKNYVQATLLGMGFSMYLQAQDRSAMNSIRAKGGMIKVSDEGETIHIGNHLDCLLISDQSTCNNSKSRHGIQCAWCDHTKGSGWDPKQMKSIGEGSCYISSDILDYGCSFLPGSTLKPLVDDLIYRSIEPPTLSKQAECLILTFDLDSCRANPSCGTCEIPDVYGLRWSSDKTEKKTMIVCAMKQLLYGNMEKPSSVISFFQKEVSSGWCKKLNEIPKEAKNYLSQSHMKNKLLLTLESYDSSTQKKPNNLQLSRSTTSITEKQTFSKLINFLTNRGHETTTATPQTSSMTSLLTLDAKTKIMSNKANVVMADHPTKPNIDTIKKLLAFYSYELKTVLTTTATHSKDLDYMEPIMNTNHLQKEDDNIKPALTENINNKNAEKNRQD